MNYLSLEHNYEEIPIKQEDRKYTDIICALLSAAFAITIFVFALLAFLPNVNNSSKYFKIDPKLVVTAVSSDITKADFVGFLNTIFWTSVISFSIGLLWLSVNHNAALYIPKIACLLAFFSLLLIAIFSIFIQNTLFQNNIWLRWTVVGITGFLALVMLAYVTLYRKELHFQGLMLKFATVFLNQRPGNFFDVLNWTLFTLGLFFLFFFQQISFSYSKITNNNFFDFSNPSQWGILNIIQILWGLEFLKDSFILVVSGNAINWYWRHGNRQNQDKSSLGWNNLLCHNWGSVACGSFLNAFFKIPLLILELLVCHPQTCCGKLGVCCQNNFRTDSYAYTNLFGTNYCDSSRQCIKLLENISIMRGKQSPQRNYRLVATIFLTTLGFILSYLILTKNVVTINGWFIAFLLYEINSIVYYFASLHASAAQGIQTSALVELIKDGGFDFMQHCHSSIRKELQNLEARVSTDGGC